MIGKYHTSITNDALDSYFNSEQLDVISKSNVDSDSFFDKKKDVSDGYVVNAQHFNHTNLENCDEFLEKAEEVTIESFIEAAESDEADEDENYMKAFYNFGRLLHCIQDFYSHTNWINQTGPEVRVWNEDADNPNIDNPEDFKTGKYSYFSQFLDKINIFKQNSLKKGKNYEETYVDGSSDISHYLLNKDEPGSIADKAFESQYGVSGFDLVIEDATEHSELEWQEIDAALQEELDPEEYAKFLEKLKEFKPENDDFDDLLDECRENFNDEMAEE